ncbi:MAG TPA: NADH-quinone oxidoreductase subunit N, partial [Symbiobacteriaceae bacterium]
MPPINWTQAVNPNYIFLLPELIVVATALLVMIADFYVSQKRSLVWVSLAGIALALAGVWYGATDPAIRAAMEKGRPLEFFGNMMVADGFSFFLKAVFLGIAGMVILFSVDFVEKYLRGMYLEFYEILLASTLGMMIMVSSADLLNLYLGLELTSIASYVLAGVLRKDPKSNEAALKYFVFGAVASAVLLFGLSLVYGVTGTTHLGELVAAVRALLAGEAVGGMTTAAVPVLVTGMLLMVGGLGFKVAAVPFHLWAPDVYEGAPAPVTGFFSVGPKGAAVGAILRIFAAGLAVAGLAEKWVVIWAVLAVASMFVGNLTALVQTNIKRMMAYSSIAQAGYILVGVVAAGNLESALGSAAVLYYVMAYAITNLGIFAIISHMEQEGGWVTLDDYRGLAFRNPVYAWALMWFFVSLIGIPPTVGFFGKLFIFRAAVDAGYLWLAVLMAINSVISVGYYYNVVRAMFLEEPGHVSLHTSRGSMAAVVISCVGVLVAG